MPKRARQSYLERNFDFSEDDGGAGYTCKRCKRGPFKRQWAYNHRPKVEAATPADRCTPPPEEGPDAAAVAGGPAGLAIQAQPPAAAAEQPQPQPPPPPQPQPEPQPGQPQPQPQQYLPDFDAGLAAGQQLAAPDAAACRALLDALHDPLADPDDVLDDTGLAADAQLLDDYETSSDIAYTEEAERLDTLFAALDEMDADDEGGQAAEHPWAEVADELVTDWPGCGQTVRQAAFQHLEDLHRGAPLAGVEKNIRDTLKLFPGSPAPDNPRNRYPPSIHLCRAVLGVGSLDDYEVHVCPAGCPHRYPHMTRSQWQEHAALQLCGADCHRCKCPQCGASRFMQLENGAYEPAAPCYFFPDALQQLYYDPVWVRHVEKGHQLSAFVRSHEGQRVQQRLTELGYDLDKV